MPTYDFKCKCGHTFEKFLSMKAKNPKCPECKGKVKRLIGAGCGVIFKGGGWPGEDIKKGQK